MNKGILLTVLMAAGLALAEGLPKGPGVDLVYAKCQICHDLTYVVENAGLSEEDWVFTVDDMIDFGAPINEEEREAIIRYLATYMGPNPPPAEEPAGEGGTEAAVDGKAAYAASCAGCHQADGEGLAGAFPPLRNNPVLVKDVNYPALVVLFGLQGEMKVGDAVFNSMMPPVAHLDDATVAAVVNFLLREFNPELLPEDFQPLDAATVAELRAKALTPKQVLELRNELDASP